MQMVKAQKVIIYQAAMSQTIFCGFRGRKASTRSSRATSWFIVCFIANRKSVETFQLEIICCLKGGFYRLQVL